MFKKIALVVITLSVAALLAAGPPLVAQAGQQDVLAVASGNASLSVFVQLVDESGLRDTLESEGPFTLLAPTDDALAQLGEGAVSELLRPENAEALAAFVNRHVMRGLYSVDNIRAMGAAETAGGDTLPVDGSQSALNIGGAGVVQGNIAAANGIVHIVDSAVKA